MTDQTPVSPLNDAALATLFTSARSQNGWQDKPLPEGTVQALYDLTKMGPTSANCSPARFIFVQTPEGKERLRPCMSQGNLAKTMAAPLTVIVAHDRKFYDRLPQLFPHTDARPWFTGSEAFADAAAFRNGTLQGAYLIMATRALGLGTGPMSGFDVDKLREAFMAGTSWEPNFLINIGFGDPAAVMPRLPRLAFDEACLMA